ncbi:unnamed protein product [Prunus armeniaca]|uniref:Receptor ligand binding region domain-containing protein n=1 Tax=Prunus armeniaca TaxID=36596 RepID=A0A6J5W4P2_PRUAR|nr:unnamed protein product [Prunus armeniaca]
MLGLFLMTFIWSVGRYGRVASKWPSKTSMLLMYKTRLVLHFRDAKKNVVHAAAAALDLIKNEQVQAIIGPVTSMETTFVINLGDQT